MTNRKLEPFEQAAIQSFAKELTEGENPRIKHLAWGFGSIGYYWIEGEDPGEQHIPDECPACAIRQRAGL